MNTTQFVRLFIVFLVLTVMGYATIPAHAEFETPSGVTTLQPTLDERISCRSYPVIILLVDADIQAGIQERLSRFENDLCAQGYGVLTTTVADATPVHIRGYLADKYTQYAGMVDGTILMGDIPHAYQLVTYSFNDTPAEAVSMQYYSDLDGIFAKSRGYQSPGGHTYSYDIHSGNVDWEIWVGVLPVYVGNDTATVHGINNYLDKNHAYRTFGTNIPRAYLQINEHATANNLAEDALYLDHMRSGQYAWVPFSNAPNAHLYFNSYDPAHSVANGLEALSQGVADFTTYGAHGWSQANGQHSIEWMMNNPTRTIFYWAGGCAVGNIDETANWLSTGLYHLNSEMLLIQATTQNSGGLGSNLNGFYGANIAQAMANGEGAGDALVSHVNVPLMHPWSEDREMHTALVILGGDPTLTLDMGHPDHENVIASP